MTELVEDYIEVDCQIGGNEWHVIEAEVELSEAQTPNYVDMIITPDVVNTVPELPDAGDISQIVGKDFTLKVKNSLDAYRSANTTVDLEGGYKLLFEGELANISPVGENSFEAIAHDPMQQPFNADEGSGSIANQKLRNVIQPTARPISGGSVVYTITAEDMINEILREAKINPDSDKVDIFLPSSGVERELPSGDFVGGGIGQNISLDESETTVLDGLNKIAEKCRAEWWFSKDGTFNFKFPNPEVHKLQWVIDSSAGITTPPYQSVKVVGKGAASRKGYGQNERRQAPSNDIVKTARIAKPKEPKSNEKAIVIGQEAEPVFRYVNSEISTQEQAKNTAVSILDDFIKQQATGTVTVPGFPEISIFDGIELPGTKDDAPDLPINRPSGEDAPMGGYRYGVTKIVHRLNNSDGFITKIHVSGPIDATRAAFLDGIESSVISAEDAKVYNDNYLGNARPP